MRPTRTATLVVAIAAAVAVPAAHAAKGKSTRFEATKEVNALIPDRAGPNGLVGSLTSTIEAPKRTKGKQIRDVNVTVRTLGATGAQPGEDLTALLSAPDGTTAFLFQNLEGFTGAPSVSIGPITLDDEASFLIGQGEPVNATRAYVPWAARLKPEAPLFPMDGGRARGAWTLRMLDAFTGSTSVLASWSLEVTAGRPFRTR
jgi:hypothetical protein